jgi:hypothetical protein
VARSRSRSLASTASILPPGRPGREPIYRRGGDQIRPHSGVMPSSRRPAPRPG